MSDERIPDHLHYQRYEFKPEKCDLNDFSKLKIANGRIYFGLYRQDGSIERMEIEDTYQNRLYVSWFQIHDRYPPPFVHPDELARWETDGGASSFFERTVAFSKAKSGTLAIPPATKAEHLSETGPSGAEA